MCCDCAPFPVGLRVALWCLSTAVAHNVGHQAIGGIGIRLVGRMPLGCTKGNSSNASNYRKI